MTVSYPMGQLVKHTAKNEPHAKRQEHFARPPGKNLTSSQRKERGDE